MNRIEILPIELQEKIYYEAHKLKFDFCIERIKNHFEDHLSTGAIKNMTILLYSTGLSDIELKNYIECLNWLDGYSINHKKLHNNMYYIVFQQYWFWNYQY